MSLLGLHARSAAGWAHMRRELTEELDLIRSSGLWKSERVITTRQEALIGVGDREERVLNFCANNYLGLSVGDRDKCSVCRAMRDVGLSGRWDPCGTTLFCKTRKYSKMRGRGSNFCKTWVIIANLLIF